MKLLKEVLVVGIIFLLLLPSASAWFGEPLPSEDHTELTEQALSSVENNDTFNQYDELYSLPFNFYIKLGSAYLDLEAEAGSAKPKENNDLYIDFSYGHFYHPNGSSYNDQWPSAADEAQDWLNDIIKAYARGDIFGKSEAYKKLGYMMHLLEDMAVPAHSHLILHGINLIDYLEFWARSDLISASTKAPIIVYKPYLSDPKLC